MTLDPTTTAEYKQTFFPYASEATDRVLRLGGRFVYYTTAATALQVISNGEIWMRNTQVMNDFMEVEHGLNCVVDAYRSTAGTQLDAALDACFPGISADIKSLFDSWIPGFRTDTFVACLSEHTPEEDLHGRLSMWRAYGGAAGVALVIRGEALFRPSQALGAYSSPVGYFDTEGIRDQLATVASQIQAKPHYGQSLGRDGLKNAVFHMLRFGAICTKHPAFKEECEWRVVASPAIQASLFLPPKIEVIGGVPQAVLKVQLVDHPDQGLYGLTPPDLLDRVLVGPCEHSDVICRALRHALADAGVADPDSKIVNTRIPLRLNQR